MLTEAFFIYSFYLHPRLDGVYIRKLLSLKADTSYA